MSEQQVIISQIERMKSRLQWAVVVGNAELAETYHSRIVQLEFLAREHEK